MTQDEVRRQKADLLLEYQETEHKLAVLHESATARAKDIQQFAQWLQFNAVKMIYEQGQVHHGFEVQILELKYRTALDYQKALDLADEIRETSAKLKDLSKRKERLGLK